MANDQFENRDSFLAPARHAYDLASSVHATNPLPNFTRAVMVSTDGVIITGYLEGDSVSHTTYELKAGLMYPMAFKRITAITGGTAKGYW